MASVRDFYNKLIKTDLSRPSRFQVNFNKPNGLPAEYANHIPSLSFKCESAQLPSRAIMTTEQKIYGYSEKFPYLTAYEDAQFTLLVGDNMREKKLFDSWLQLVQPTNSYNLNYKSSYTTTVEIIQYNLRGDERYKVKLEKAYPIAVNQMDLDWSADGYHRLLVIFAYSTWSTSY